MDFPRFLIGQFAAALLLASSPASAATASLDSLAALPDAGQGLQTLIDTSGPNTVFTLSAGLTVTLWKHINLRVPNQKFVCAKGAKFRLADRVSPIGSLFGVSAAGVELQGCEFDGNQPNNTANVTLLFASGNQASLKLVNIHTHNSVGHCIYIAGGVHFILRDWRFDRCSPDATQSSLLVSNPDDTASTYVNIDGVRGDRSGADPAKAAVAAIFVVGTKSHPTQGRFCHIHLREPINPMNVFGAIGVREAPLEFCDIEGHDGSLGLTFGGPTHARAHVENFRWFGGNKWGFEVPGDSDPAAAPSNVTLTNFLLDGMGSDGVIRSYHPMSLSTNGGHVVVSNGIIRRFSSVGIYVYGHKTDVTLNNIYIDASQVHGWQGRPMDRYCVGLRGERAGAQGPERVKLHITCRGGGAASRALYAENVNDLSGDITADGIRGYVTEIVADGVTSDKFNVSVHSPDNVPLLLKTSRDGGRFGQDIHVTKANR